MTTARLICPRLSLLPRRFSSSTAGPQTDPIDLPSNSTTTTTPPSPPHSSSPASSSSNPSNFADQIAQKDAQLNEYKVGFSLHFILNIERKETRADFENLQKITTREKAAAKEYALQSFARDLVSNIDVLQLALNSVPEGLRTTNVEEESGGSSSDRKYLADLWGGVQSTKSLLEKTLARHGVVPFDPTGQPCPAKNPTLCSTVQRLVVVGWMLRDRVLRPAQVGVAQGSSDS
ncbi:uncharacterized protein VP01_2800g2 [Puccinia sorghi]|uniref:GrpE protein homolog, mitochondrial n=1 Tax=Puccinia sorghi TaxID=27349 RepID=A0A0L6V4C3_9BASI|nr:uncharacterized protein VP01_2800g2 [Puccinia sorghi]